MALVVTCPCGERLEAPDSQAGKQVPCPACGKPVELPRPYNPLSTAQYMQTAADAPPEPEERVAGEACPECVGSGTCRYCRGQGRLDEPFLERLTNGITGFFTGLFGSMGDSLGADRSGKRKKVQTRSERLRAGACPGCEGSGKCFSCEGKGRNPG